MKTFSLQKCNPVFRTVFHLFALIILTNFSVYAQGVSNGTTTQTVKPVVMNFMDQVKEFTANPPVLTAELKTPKNPTKFPEYPLPPGVSANVFTGSPKISGVGGQTQSQLPSANAPSPAPSLGFTAIIDNGVTIPPDVAGAVGPNHVMTTLNNGLMIQDKTGGNPIFINDNTFFTVEVSSSIFDPKVFYDKYTQRYYFIDLNGSSSASTGILLAVSQTNDPTGNWNQYRFQSNTGTGESNTWFDYPMVGYNKDWLVISGNMFADGGGFSKAKVFVIKKSDILAGLATTPTEFSPSASTISPAIVDDNTTDFIPLVSRWNSAAGTIRVAKLSGTPPAAPTFTDIGYPTVGSGNGWSNGFGNGNFGPQKDMTSATNGLAPGDTRMCQSVYKNGEFWAIHIAFLSQVVSGSTVQRGAVQWFNLDPNAATITEWGRIDDPNTTNLGSFDVATNSFSFPSIAVNNNEDVLINFAHFSPNHYPSASYAIRPAGTANFDDTHLYKSGVEHYYKTFGGGRNRWGDYTLAMVDPSNGLDFWAVGEYSEASVGSGSNSDRWATYWAKVSTIVETSTAINITSNLCVEKDYNLDFTAEGFYNPGNTFNAELSDLTGSFASPLIVGSLPGVTDGVIVVNIPASVMGGSDYQIRVSSSNTITNNYTTQNVNIVGKDLAINDTSPSPTEATETITAQDITISGNQKYKAGKSITLIATPSTNVSTTNGTVFETEIVGCPY